MVDNSQMRIVFIGLITHQSGVTKVSGQLGVTPTLASQHLPSSSDIVTISSSGRVGTGYPSSLNHSPSPGGHSPSGSFSVRNSYQASRASVKGPELIS